jgi:hypothetical protein
MAAAGQADRIAETDTLTHYFSSQPEAETTMNEFVRRNYCSFERSSSVIGSMASVHLVLASSDQAPQIESNENS